MCLYKISGSSNVEIVNKLNNSNVGLNFEYLRDKFK
jgi:hypothetical protein